MHPPSDLALALPVELYHEIFLFLDVKDILTLRKTCRLFLALTCERELWSMMFARLRATQALPCSRAEFTTMPPKKAEQVLLAATEVERSFLAPREHILRHIPPSNESASTWRQLTFISDRFLLSVDNDTVAIWDTSALLSPALLPAVTSSPWACFPLSNVIGYVESSSTLYIAVSCVDKGQRRAIVYSVCLPVLGETDDHDPRLQEEAQFSLGDGELLKHMDPHLGRALLLCARNVLQVLYWWDSHRRIVISMSDLSNNPDQLWDGITSLRFCGPYILCFRLRSVEAYPIPVDAPSTHSMPVLRYEFGSLCFRAVSLSHVRVSRCPTGEVYTIFMLTNDIYMGMFHYRICLTTAPVPSMSVQLLAKGGIPMGQPLPMVPGTDVRYTLNDMFRRMFVSTWSLGSAGLRGVWVDRQRGDIPRRVVAFTTHPGRLRTNAQGSEVSPEPGVGDNPDSDGNTPGELDEVFMKGQVIHVISSYDLRDDITICAVSEWTGCIAMVPRDGSILII